MNRCIYLTILAGALILTGCQSSSTTATGQQDTTAASGGGGPVLRVGTAASAPPIVFRDGKQIKGLEIDLANEIGARLQRKVQITSMFWPDLTYELRNRRIDVIMAGMSITPKRKLEVSFCQPYLAVGQQAMTQTRDATRIPDTAGLNRTGVRIGVETDSTGQSFARSNLRNAQVITYKTLAEATDALLHGEIDAVVHDSPSINWQVAHDESGLLRLVPGLLTNESLAWAVRLEDDALRQDLDRALAEMKADGTLQKLLDRWGVGGG